MSTAPGLDPEADVTSAHERAGERAAFATTARSAVRTAVAQGSLMLPFGSRAGGTAAVSASLRTFAKPGTWFAPMWAMLVGCIGAGAGATPLGIAKIVLGMVLAGPLLCAFSQVVNDWFDRDVDRINDPERPTAANVMAPRTVLVVVLALALAALGLAAALGTRVLLLAIGGLALALAYSAPPLRLKARNGWLANAACAFAYEGFAWLAGSAIFGRITTGTIVFAALYSLATHGLMTLNDFKSYDGDARLGLRSLPVLLGRARALAVAVTMIDVFQLLAIGALLVWHAWIAAAVVAVLLVVQLPMQRRLATDPAGLAPWYCASAIPPLVWGMMACAIALRIGGF